MTQQSTAPAVNTDAKINNDGVPRQPHQRDAGAARDTHDTHKP